jgi:hypothetical protein
MADGRCKRLVYLAGTRSHFQTFGSGEIRCPPRISVGRTGGEAGGPVVACRRHRIMDRSFRFYAGLVLAVFTLVAAFSMHKFWDETDGELQFLELLHFLKNLLIVAVLIFLAIGES